MSNVAYADFGNQRRQERPTVADLDKNTSQLQPLTTTGLITCKQKILKMKTS